MFDFVNWKSSNSTMAVRLLKFNQFQVKSVALFLTKISTYSSKSILDVF